MLDLKNAQDAAKAPPGKTVQDKVRFFQNLAAPSARIKTLENRVARNRTWLELQGAVVDRDGKVDWRRTHRVVE